MEKRRDEESYSHKSFKSSFKQMLLREVSKSTMVEESMAVNVQDGSTRVIDPDQNVSLFF